MFLEMSWKFQLPWFLNVEIVQIVVVDLDIQ